MIREVFRVFKSNPLITVFYFVFTWVPGLLTTYLLPEAMSDTRGPLPILINILVSAFVFSGIGNMCVIAFEENTNPIHFVQGISRYFVNMFLMCLFAYILVFFNRTIFLIVFIPGVFINAASQLDLYLALIALIFIPLSSLWYPAIFFDKLSGYDSLRRGFKLGVKTYFIQLAGLIVIFALIKVYTNISFDHSSYLYSISYEVLISIISILYIISLFTIYRNSTKITGTTLIINGQQKVDTIDTEGISGQ